MCVACRKTSARSYFCYLREVVVSAFESALGLVAAELVAAQKIVIARAMATAFVANWTKKSLAANLVTGFQTVLLHLHAKFLVAKPS